MRYSHKRKHGERVHFFHPGQTRAFTNNKHKETFMGIGKRIVTLTCFTMLAAAGIPSSHAQEKWPGKPITYVVPFAAGGTTDILGRLISQRLSPMLGVPVVIENKAGAGGNIGSDFVAKAAPDGYTLVGGTISSHSINVSLYAKMPYDPVKNFAPVTLIGTLPNVLVVNANSPYRSVADVIAAAKAKPEAAAPRSICRASCSRTWPASTCCMCLSRAAHRPRNRCWASKSPWCLKISWPRFR
jgi:hypothetical protein